MYVSLCLRLASGMCLCIVYLAIFKNGYLEKNPKTTQKITNGFD